MKGSLYAVLRLLFIGVGRLFFRFRTSGREHVPREGGLLIAANHASYLDIPVLGCGLPRRAAYLGRQDLFRWPILNCLMRSLGWIPLRHDRVDRGGLRTAVRLIKDGNSVVIYPEGTRSRDGRLGRGKPGLGVIVAEAGCPVLPVYIGGTHEVLPVGALWPRLHPIRVVIGAPIDFSQESQEYSRKEFYQHVSRTVMARIAELGQVAQPTEPSAGRAQEAEQPGEQPAARPFNAE